MDIKQLRYFVEVARQHSFTTASRVLYVTQPALSRQVAELEDELNETLLDRSTRRIELTAKGSVLFRRAVHILELVDKAKEEVMQQKELAGELSIVAAETPAMQCVADVVTAFTKKHPHVTVQLQSANALDAAVSLKTGSADLGVFNLPADLSGLDYFKLQEKNVWGILTRRNGEFAGKTKVRAEELSGKLLYVPRQKALQNLLAGSLEKAQQLFEGAGTYNLLFNASLLVRSAAHALCIGGIVAEDDTVMFLPIVPSLTTEVAVAWPHGADKTELTHAFLTALRKSCQCQPGKEA